VQGADSDATVEEHPLARQRQLEHALCWWRQYLDMSEEQVALNNGRPVSSSTTSSPSNTQPLGYRPSTPH
jgi:hypothetical protein